MIAVIGIIIVSVILFVSVIIFAPSIFWYLMVGGGRRDED